MDRFVLVIIILLFPIFSFSASLPPAATVDVSQVGSSLVYKINPNGSGAYVPNPAAAPVGTGVQNINGTTSVIGNTIIRDYIVKAGSASGTIRVSTLVTNAKAAIAVIAGIKSPGVVAALVAGSAILDLLQRSGVTVNANSQLVSSPIYVNAPVTQCSEVGAVGDIAYFVSAMTTYSIVEGTCNPPAQPVCAHAINNCTNFPAACKGAGYFPVLCGSSPTVDPASYTSPVILSDPVAQSKLVAKMPTDMAPVIRGTSIAPVNSPPDTNPSIISGVPSPVVSPTTTSVLPDGTVQTSTDTTTFTKNADGSMTVTKTTTVVQTKPDLTSKTVTITNPIDIPTSPTQTTSNQTDCDKYPSSVGCLQIGEIPIPDVVPTKTVTLPFSPTSLGSGSCPADIPITVHGKTLAISYSYVCSFASKISPIVIALAWLSAGFIVLGPVKES